jgi:hypothetical protein
MVIFFLLKGNWNYFAANRPEKKAPKFEATHREKAMELYQSVCIINFSLAICYLLMALSFGLA